ncbi:MAG: hypothetical protein P4L74_06480 [Candidatus Doudnabacteria bacterium]|nr:hypothetical protein [Candidatus Doudnabacteria bacterium]
MNFSKTLLAAGLVAYFFVAIGCGPSAEQRQAARLAQQEAAKSAALTDYASFRAATTGAQAEQFRAKIKGELATADLGVEAISLSDNELQAHQNELYNVDAVAAARQLHNTHGNSQKARELATECRNLKGKSGQPVSPALERGLELAVARNMREEATAISLAHGVNPPTKKGSVRRRLRAQR